MPRDRRRWALLGLCAAILAGCGGDESDTPLDPGPHEGVDQIVFSVYRSDPFGLESLAWRGTVDGPSPDSPESTPVPWVGFLQPFRVSWEADSAGAPIVGTRIRASKHAGAAFFAIDPYGDGTWGRGTSFRFANAIPASDLIGVDCPTGPDCPDRLRFSAGPCSLRVLAIDANGEMLDARLGNLLYQVNFEPHAQWLVDESNTEHAPYWTAPALDGSTIRRSIVAGDTIPSGVRVHLLMRGSDRLWGTVPPDSACCDQRLDDQVPVLRFQARTYLEQRLSSTVVESRQTTFARLAPDSALSVVSGPFEYRLGGRVADEHATRSAEVNFTFVAGLRPSRPTMTPGPGTGFVFLPPEQPIPTGENGPLYSLAPAQRRWSVSAQDWVVEGEGELLSGHFYRVPLGMRAQPHPRVAEIHPYLAPGVTDHVRAFAYELIGEFDPFNRRVNGRSDLITRFLDADDLGVLDLVDAEGYQIFVPHVFWFEPTWFAPELAGSQECLPALATYCSMGDRIREDLGRFTFRAVARSTELRSELAVLPPLAADSTGAEIPLDLARFGRHSEIGEHQFTLRMRVQVDGSPEPVLWPFLP